MRTLQVTAWILGAGLVACSSGETAPSASSSAASAASTAATSTATAAAIEDASSSVRDRLAALREAEHRRAPQEITEADLESRDVLVRRAAARALARIGASDVRPKLLRLLGDEDPEVVRWAAYGLGYECTQDRDATVDALVARALALPDTDVWADAFHAIARSVGACASPTRSEATLSAWLGASEARARAASLGLGDFARRTKRLREETWVLLFARAAGGVSDPALPEALYAVSRVENVPPSVVGRLAEVATARLSDAGPYRLFAIRALGRARADGLAPLERILLEGGATFTMPERVEAARSAARLGRDGQVLLGKALEKLALKITPAAPIQGDDETAVLLATLAAITDPLVATRAIKSLSVVPAPEGADARARRIASLVRCASARLIPNVKPSTPVLLGCDLDAGWIGDRTLAEVLGRSAIRGGDLATFKKLVADPDARVREAALELLGSHPEIPDAHVIVADALAAKEPGVVTVAAEQIEKSPRLASAPAASKTRKKDRKKDEDDPKKADAPLSPPSKEVETALTKALERAERDQDLELLGSVIDAIGALGQKSLLPKLQPFCGSIHPTARERAANAIALLSNGKRPECPAPARSEVIAPEVLAPATSDVTLILDTDAGELVLELAAKEAPVAVARFTALAKRGLYDGTVMHRVDPSFVVQFGSPFADGYGALSDAPPLRCETSPLPFDALSVGVALSGRDTGGSQLFVMRARHPHLDGDYALVGTAKGPWDRVFEGDVIRKVVVTEK